MKKGRKREKQYKGHIRSHKFTKHAIKQCMHKQSTAIHYRQINNKTYCFNRFRSVTENAWQYKERSYREIKHFETECRDNTRHYTRHYGENNLIE